MRLAQRLVVLGGRLPPPRSPGNILAVSWDVAFAVVGTDTINGLPVNTLVDISSSSSANQISNSMTFTMNAGQIYTFAVYAKRFVGTRDLELMLYDDAYASVATVNVSLATGQPLIAARVSGSFGAPTVSVKPYAQHWFGVSLGFTGASSTGAHAFIHTLQEGSTASETGFTGDDVSGLAWFGADFR